MTVAFFVVTQKSFPVLIIYLDLQVFQSQESPE